MDGAPEKPSSTAIDTAIDAISIIYSRPIWRQWVADCSTQVQE